jgi:putative aldouronate transport system permease protein
MKRNHDFNAISPAANVCFHVILIALAAACVLPLFLIVSISVSSKQSLEVFGYRFIPAAFSLEGYAYLFREKITMMRALAMSMFVTAGGTFLGVLLTALMGYGLSRQEFKLQKFLMWFTFIPMVFGGGLVATYFVTGELLHLRNTVWALILPLAVSPFNVVLCRTFFKSTIPDALLESAKMDGANQFIIFFRLILPLSLPVLATIGLFLSFGYWNDWFQAMLYIDNPSLYTLQALLNKLLNDISALARNAQAMGLTAAQLMASMPGESARMGIVVLVVLPIACTYPFFQRYFVSGLMVGSIKG